MSMQSLDFDEALPTFSSKPPSLERLYSREVKASYRYTHEILSGGSGQIEMISAEVSLYPLETTESDAVIKNSLRALAEGGLEFEVGPLSTKISGSPDEVWRGLRALFERAHAHGGEVSMVVTISNSKP